jgi:hypothetical protein
MTQTAETGTESTPVTSRLGQVTAWVVIVAGVVFVVAVIFFSGLFLGFSSGIRSGWHHGYDGGRYGGCPMMEPGAMMGPGGMHPGGPIGPSQLPTTSVPATPHP